MKVIGAGFGRTGTKSLQEALTILGYGPCYHMEALFRNPTDVKHWNDALNDRETDWGRLFENYNSAVDFPVSIYYKQLAQYYPDSKFILTVRDTEKWHASALSTIYAFEPNVKTKLRMIAKLPFF